MRRVPPDRTAACPSPDSDAAAAAFIAEHGRLPRHPSHPAFDPFRRHVPHVPLWVAVAQRLASILLIPLRLLVTLVAALLAYALVMVFGPRITPHLVATFATPALPAWRRRLVAFANRLLARALLLGLGFWRVRGRDHPAYRARDAARATLVSNHASLADPCLLAFLYAPAFVAKANVFRLPLIGRVGAAQNTFFVDRIGGGAGGGSGTGVTEHIVERQRRVAAAAGRDAAAAEVPAPMAIFPEGTTTNGEHLLRFRTGAFVGGMPVAPVLIRYAHGWFSPAYETVRTAEYVLGLLSQFANRVEYWRMPVYYPNAAEKTDARLYARNVHARMMREWEEVFGRKLRASDSNFVDKLEYHSIVRGTKLKKGLQLNKLT